METIKNINKYFTRFLFYIILKKNSIRAIILNYKILVVVFTFFCEITQPL